MQDGPGGVEDEVEEDQVEEQGVYLGQHVNDLQLEYRELRRIRGEVDGDLYHPGCDVWKQPRPELVDQVEVDSVP